MPFNKEKKFNRVCKNRRKAFRNRYKESLQACLDQANEKPKINTFRFVIK